MNDMIKVKFKLIFEKGDWDLFCNEKGYNAYMFNEGLVSDDDYTEITADELVRYLRL